MNERVVMEGGVVGWMNERVVMEGGVVELE